MIDQVGIAVFGCTAVWLSQSLHPPTQRYACIFGLLAQPFWYWAAFSTEQWGIVLVCIPYTAAWLRGFYNHWILKGQA